jgi:hypothetical protein
VRKPADQENSKLLCEGVPVPELLADLDLRLRLTATSSRRSDEPLAARTVDQKAGGSSIGFQIFNDTIDRLLQKAASGPKDQTVLSNTLNRPLQL